MKLSALPSALSCAALALLYRGALAGNYYGQEEGDYGNLGLILGTVQSGFSYVETEHMPMYTWLSAVACLLVGDAHTGGLLVSLVMGAVTVGIVTWCASRWLSPEAGLVTGLLLVFQPDLALTSATTLRTSTYTAFAAATLAAAGSRRWVLAGGLFGAAFLTRFDAILTLLPVLGLAAVLPWLRAEPAPTRRRAIGLGIPFLVTALWAGLYARIHGHPRFWEGVVARNTASYEDLGLIGRIAKGSETLWLVGREVLPDHLGWSVLALFPVGLALLARGRAREAGPARSLGLMAVAATGLFAVTVLLSAYRWDHNLYWGWLALALPFLLPIAAHGGVETVRGLGGRRAGAAVLGAGLGLATALPMYRQTWHQMTRSDQWIGSQVRLAEWADHAVPEGAPLLADLVPATWIGRRPDSRPVLRWSQLGDRPAADSREAFALWVREEGVRVIVWFREDWVGAADRAPFLSEAAAFDAGGLHFEPVAAEEGYGFVAWRVDGPGLPPLDPPQPE
ncbi:MAG: glycosyltransferase family 39 protein [Deltaproteobacteria bacterium]|nr:glycosyltransferase family 39 protein [Deltaproteobacteria bacterium]